MLSPLLLFGQEGNDIERCKKREKGQRNHSDDGRIQKRGCLSA